MHDTPPRRRLSLDHITVVDTTPSQLVETAAAVGCGGIGLFLHPMAVLPRMPHFELIGDTPERRATSDAMRERGIALDIVYPFTLGRRTVVSDFEPALETAACLGAGLANVLSYNRDTASRLDQLAGLAELAARYAIGLSIEFYSPSQITSCRQALQVVDALDQPNVGVTVDLLHLMRGGEFFDALPLLADDRIRIAQICDGPAMLASDQIEWEAGVQRLLPGDGTFDISAFVAALSPDVLVSVEVPQEAGIIAGTAVQSRASAALSAARLFTDSP